MSSAVNPQNLIAADIDMLRRVLDTAGIFDLDTKWHLELRLRFDRLLIRAFQQSVTVEGHFVSMLVSKIVILHPSCIPCRSTENLTVSRLEKDHGQRRRPPNTRLAFTQSPSAQSGDICSRPGQAAGRG